MQQHHIVSLPRAMRVGVWVAAIAVLLSGSIATYAQTYTSVPDMGTYRSPSSQQSLSMLSQIGIPEAMVSLAANDSVTASRVQFDFLITRNVTTPEGSPVTRTTICESTIGRDVDGNGSISSDTCATGAVTLVSPAAFNTAVYATSTLPEIAARGTIELFPKGYWETTAADMLRALGNSVVARFDITANGNNGISLYLYNVRTTDVASDDHNSATFHAVLNKDQQVPKTDSAMVGHASFSMTPDERSMSYTVQLLQGRRVLEAHLHCGAVGQNGPAIVPIFSSPTGVDVDGTLASGTIDEDDILSIAATCDPNITTMPHLIQAIREGKIYINVHTANYPNGAARGQLMQ